MLKERLSSQFVGAAQLPAVRADSEEPGRLGGLQLATCTNLAVLAGRWPGSRIWERSCSDGPAPGETFAPRGQGTYQGVGRSGYDIATIEDVVIYPGER